MKKCEKCGYESEDNREIFFNEKKIFLCNICKQFMPEENISKYLEEKTDWKILETYRKFQQKITSGMQEKAQKGRVMSRAPYGYKIIKKELVIDEEKKLIVQKIFMDFLEQDTSLNQLSKKYSLSINGLKKILKNFTYLGKIKFAGQISQGTHQPIISSELFNKVQNKLEKVNTS